MPRFAPKSILVTGGCGFIGSNFLLQMVPRFPDVKFVNIDALTYAGNALNLEPLATTTNYSFVHGDISDSAAINALFTEYEIDCVVHFAAESHVDRSIHGPRAFLETNVGGTFALLEVARTVWKERKDVRFHHVSTDEVYGSLGATGQFAETHAYDPSSPYSASKAASDHFVRAYHRTFGVPVTITNCSNNYGPLQFPEKLIPLMILNAFEDKPLPIYGDGSNVRDWLHVSDHCDAIWTVMVNAVAGETYNIGGECERTNVEIVDAICGRVAAHRGIPVSEVLGLKTFVTDRPGHDHRYAIDSTKVRADFGWTPAYDFESGLSETVDWFLSNQTWIEQVRSGAYRQWLSEHYEQGAAPEVRA